jgi:hydrogenase-4 component B
MPAVAGLACVAALFAIGLVAIAIGRSRAGTAAVYGASLVVSAIALLFASTHLILASPPASITLPLGLPWIGAHFRIDALAAFFLIIVNLGGAIASIYALGYGAHEGSPLRVLPFYPAFLGAMNLVVLADDAFVFLLSWEFMSLVSWGMVVAHHRVAANVRAGYIYLVMASFGTLCLFLAFGVLAGTSGQYSFAAMRGSQLTPALALVAGTLTLIGAGSKAGIVPLHVWLPLAHPAAPSHVSALLSGVMTKVGVYGFIRIVFDLIGEPTPYAGLIVAAIGGITAALGILYALMQHDLKRLLAYSTVENIGIIFIGLGLALAFRANGIDWAAALALAAALFHVFNHSLFKSLLFFGAGSVLAATGQRNMEQLGGLIHRMPHTAFAFLIGSMAISALPPLNGFVSEWLTFQAILVSPELPQWGLKLVLPAVGALLALSAALASACFVKAFGITFLGRARSSAAQTAHEVDRFQRAAMFVLIGLCVLAGIYPGFFIDALAPVTHAMVGSAMPRQAFLSWLSIVPIVASRSSYNGLLILIFLAGSAAVTAIVIHRFATRATRRSPIWDCGFPLASPVAQYTSSSFAMPIRRVFGASVFRVSERVDMPPPGAMRAGHFQVRVFDPAWFGIYGPIVRSIRSAGIFLNRVQFLTIRSYLTLVFGALVVLLLVVAAWR